mmetsp:Transcript_22709/g.53602  ORF Transcript_22709/g.53602 Transcript_22709/m.53602 type:complete len:212 (+) Transcript_22709:345-980(+)
MILLDHGQHARFKFGVQGLVGFHLDRFDAQLSQGIVQTRRIFGFHSIDIGLSSHGSVTLKHLIGGGKEWILLGLIVAWFLLLLFGRILGVQFLLSGFLFLLFHLLVGRRHERVFQQGQIVVLLFLSSLFGRGRLFGFTATPQGRFFGGQQFRLFSSFSCRLVGFGRGRVIAGRFAIVGSLFPLLGFQSFLFGGFLGGFLLLVGRLECVSRG